MGVSPPRGVAAASAASAVSRPSRRCLSVQRKRLEPHDRPPGGWLECPPRRELDATAVFEQPSAGARELDGELRYMCCADRDAAACYQDRLTGGEMGALRDVIPRDRKPSGRGRGDGESEAAVFEQRGDLGELSAGCQPAS